MKPKPRSGAMRHRVTLQTYTDTPQGASGLSSAWTTVATFWAEIEPVSGLVYFDTQQIGKGVSHKIKILYSKTIPVTTENWLLSRGVRYRIRSVNNLQEDRRFLELLCEVEFQAVNNFEVSTEAVSDPLRDIMSE